MKAILYYIHDPMCSWCWGYRPTWKDLQLNLLDFIDVEYVAGGLAPDSNMPMPNKQQVMIQRHWYSIQEKLGSEFNFDFWTHNIPRRSTYNACRAAIAADNQGYQIQMIDAIQEAYYLRALNPSDSNILIKLAEELSAKHFSTQNKETRSVFDLATFIHDFTSEETQQLLVQQINKSRELTIQGFPSLVLECNNQRYEIPVNYEDYHATIAVINKIIKI